MITLISEHHGKKLWKISVGDWGLVCVCERPDLYRIITLWVDPEHRRQGVATELMKAALASFQDKPIYLEVDSFEATDSDPNDEQLATFYEKFGFKQITPHPYGYIRSNRSTAQSE